MSRARDFADLAGSADVGGITGRNLAINGGFQVWQRGTTADTATSGDYMCDRFIVGFSGLDGNVDWDQETSTPDGHNYALKVSTDASESSLDAGDFLRVEQRFEGQNLQLLQKGTSSAKSVTLSFWVKSSVASTYTVALDDRDTSSFREIGKSYAINSANTWEHKTVTFEGDTVGALDNDNAFSLGLYFWIDAGSTYTSGTFSSAWQARVAAERVYDTTGWLVSTSPQFYLTGVQLEIGQTATPFEHEDFGTTLRKCQRYYQRWNAGVNKDPFCIAFNNGSRYADGIFSFPVTMRDAPTALEQSGTAGNYRIGAVAGSSNCSSVPTFSKATEDTIEVRFDVGSGLTSGQAVRLLSASSSGQFAFLGWSAEL